MLSLHIDDLPQHHWGESMVNVLREMRDHVHRVGQRLQQELDPPLASHKLNMVTSTGKMTELARN
eukprot:6622511-Pyramimonas_sp.AAC.1